MTDNLAPPPFLRLHRTHLRSGLLAGAVASLASTMALAWRGLHDVGSALAPTNATSHWLWGHEAFAAAVPSWRHTAWGYAIHHSTATFWAVLYAWLHAERHPPRNAVTALAGAGVATGIAFAVDYTITPKRLRPGFEQHLSKTSMVLVYAVFALGLAAGCAAARGLRARSARGGVRT